MEMLLWDADITTLLYLHFERVPTRIRRCCFTIDVLFNKPARPRFYCRNSNIVEVGCGIV